MTDSSNIDDLKAARREHRELMDALWKSVEEMKVIIKEHGGNVPETVPAPAPHLTLVK